MVKAEHQIIPFADRLVQINLNRCCNFKGHLAWHDEMEIQFIKEGAGCYFIDGDTVPCRQNSVIIIQPREIHRFVPTSNGGIGKACLLFNPAKLGWPRLFVTDLKRLKRHVGLAIDEAEAMNLIICRIIRENKCRKSCWSSLVQTMLTEFILRIKRSETNRLSCALHPIVNRALGYIEQHYMSPMFNIEALAKELHISERHLLRLFINDVGMSIKHYVMQKRIIQAQHLIRSNPTYKLEAISQTVGFNQYVSFYRMFKIFTGVQPCAYV